MCDFISGVREVCEAVDYAAKQHQNQRRKNAAKTPYINHPIEVMKLIATAGYSITDDKDEENFKACLMAAVLHDTVEDTGATEDDIRNLFGNRVAKIVMECTDDKSLHKVERKKLQIEHAKTISKEAKFVKMADKYSNLSNLLSDPPSNWSREEILGYFVWSYAVCREINIKCKLASDLNELFQQAEHEFGVPFMSLSEEQFQQQLARYYQAIDKSE